MWTSAVFLFVSSPRQITLPVSDRGSDESQLDGEKPGHRFSLRNNNPLWLSTCDSGCLGANYPAIDDGGVVLCALPLLTSALAAVVAGSTAARRHL